MKVSTPEQQRERISEIARLLHRLGSEYKVLHDLAWAQGKRGEGGRMTGASDPTGEIATDAQRERWRSTVRHADRRITLAAKALDEAHGYLDRATRERGVPWTSLKDDTRYPPPMNGDEHKALQAKAEARRARGEE